MTEAIPFETRIKGYKIICHPTPYYSVVVQKPGLLVPEVVHSVDDTGKTFRQMYDEAVAWCEAH